MHRLIVAILAAVDAAIAVAVGIAATLAPLTLVWVFGFGDGADWAALWPAGATIWQFGNLVPLDVTIPADYLAVAGIDPGAASFTLSLAPLAFAAFTAIFAARSGVRASQADAWITGVLTGSALFAALAALIGLTAANDVAGVTLWQAVLLPTIVFALPALAGAVVTEWREAGSGGIARLRDRVEAAQGGWGAVPGLVARGTAVVVAGLIGLGALITAVAVVLRGGEIIALYEAAHLDVLGAVVVTLGQLAYLPTVVVWGLSFAAGPGFALGEGASVSPAGTHVGVLPGIPVLGIIPESTTPWLLLLALGPVALGALAGWIARSRLVSTVEPVALVPAVTAPEGADAAWRETDAASDPARTSTLAGLLAESAALREPEPEPDPDPAPQPSPQAAEGEDRIGPRLVILLGIAILAAGAAALLAAVASGSMGPGSLAEMGPAPGPVALAVGLEVILGAGILLLSPRPQRRAPRVKEPAATGEDAVATGEIPLVPVGAAPSDEVADPVAEPEPEPDPIPIPREPFTFPTLPRIPAAPHDSGEDGAKPPVD